MVSAAQLLAVLEQKDLLPAEVLQTLREQVTANPALAADTLAGQLVREKHLTPALAQRLLGAAGAVSPAKPAAAAEDDDLGFAPLEDESPRPAPTAAPPAEKTNPSAKKGEPGKKAPSPEAKASADAPSLKSDANAASRPLDQLLADELLQAPDAGLAVQPLGAPRRKRRNLRKFLRDLFRRKRGKVVYVKPNNPQKIRLMALSWGIAGGLVIALFCLFTYLAPPGPEEQLRMAESDYKTGAYAGAEQKYDRFARSFPKHALVSMARVRRGLARIQQKAAQQPPDWAAAYSVAKKSLPTLAKEEAFHDAQYDFGDLLSSIAKGLAQAAHKHPDADVIQQAQDTLYLIDQHIPPVAQPEQRLADTRTLLAASQRFIAREAELHEAVGHIGEAIQQHKAAAAFDVRDALVAQYPELTDDPRLAECLVPLARWLAAAVTLAPRAAAGETAPRANAVVASAALAQRSMPGEVSGVAGRLVFAQAAGSVFALDAPSGRLLWRRFVAVQDGGGATPFPPLPVAQEAHSDVLVVDPPHREILRLEGTTGRLLWRHAVAGPIEIPPVLAGPRVLAASADGRIEIIDLASGDGQGVIQLPQPIGLPPVVDTSRGLVFQVADRATLFVLSLRDGACQQVYYLGHRAGGITAPPALFGDLLMVGVGESPKEGTLRVFSIAASQSPHAAKAEQSQPLVKAVQQIDLHGRLKTRPLVEGPHALLVTSLGAFQILARSTDPQTPLETLAESPPLGDEEAVHFPWMQDDRFWIADAQLAQYGCRAGDGRKRIEPRQITDQGSEFLQPLWAAGNGIFQVRRKTGRPGVLVSVVDARTQETLWQTYVAVPLASEPLVDRATATLTAVSTLGSMFRVPAAAVKPDAVVDVPTVAMEASRLRSEIRSVVPLAGGMLAMTAGEDSNQIMTFDPQEQANRYRWLLVPGTMTCAPAGLGGGLLAPCKNGQVFLLDPQTLGEMAPAFQPKLQGTAWRWQTPLAADKQAVLSDGDHRLYRLVLSDGAKPKLTAGDETVTTRPLISAPAAVGKVVYVVDGTGALATFALPSLEAGKALPLPGRCTWGPRRVGRLVLVTTDKDRLLSFDDHAAQQWDVPLPYGPLAGAPCVVGDHLFLASSSGTLWQLSAATGKEQGKVDAGCPLGTGPVLVGSRMFVGGHDGTLLEVSRP